VDTDMSVDGGWRPKRRPLMFVHIPKTAGMSIRETLRSQVPVRDVFPGTSWEDLRGKPVSDIRQFHLFSGHLRYFVRGILSADSLAFTFLRDPIERTLSHLKHLRDDAKFHPLHERAVGRELKALMDDPLIVRNCTNTQVGYLSNPPDEIALVVNGRLVDCSEDDLVADPDLEAAKANLDAMDFVGFCDRIEDDLQVLLDTAGLHPVGAIPALNRAAERGIKTEIDDELREKIAIANDLDVDLYRYARSSRLQSPVIGTRQGRVEKLISSQIYPWIETDLDFPLDESIPGCGFWSAENPGKSPHRWTGPGGRICLDLPLIAGTGFNLLVTFHAPKPMHYWVAEIDGRPVDVVVHALEQNALTLRIPIEATVRSEIRRLEFGFGSGGFRDPNDARQIWYVLRQLQLRRVRS
jgi:hypothetical protein